MGRQSAILVASVSPGDWVVREDGGRELGHYPTRKDAEAVGHQLARKRGVELVVNDDSGTVQRSRPRKSWLARLFER
jgi:hypothetical protein